MLNCSGCREREREIGRMSEVIGELETANDELRTVNAILGDALTEAVSLGGDMAGLAASFVTRSPTVGQQPS